MARARDIKKGDYIVFKVATRWSSAKAKQRRKVVSIDPWGRPCVRFGGWSEFVVHPREVVEVQKCPIK